MPHHWIATLDDLAWLLNLRGADVDLTSVPGACPDRTGSSHLVRRRRQGAATLAEALQRDGISNSTYEQALPALKTAIPVACLLIDPERITWGLPPAVPESVSVIRSHQPLATLAKSCKTDAEAGFIRGSHGALMAQPWPSFMPGSNSPCCRIHLGNHGG